jgi:formylglycine-generating enzyme required for sulfatase activity
MDDGGNGCGTGRTWSVCSKTAGNTVQGLCDMAGNVWEWVEDDYHFDYTGAPTDGSAWVDSPRDSLRVFRGGCFGNVAGALRAASRLGVDPSVTNVYLGFRCAR